MDGLNDDMTFTVASPERLAVSHPFGDRECISVDLGGAVNVTQLSDEIDARAGFPVMIAMVTVPGSSRKLYVCPVVPEDVIVQAVSDHVPDELYGLDTLQRKRYELIQKLSSHDELSNEEMREALMLVLSG